MPMTPPIYDELRLLGYKICIVSPELQAQPEKLDKYAKQLADMPPDAICTKAHNIDRWKRLF
jgi:hypothetical protein